MSRASSVGTPPGRIANVTMPGIVHEDVEAAKLLLDLNNGLGDAIF
jgi:hypothetical protein